MTVESYPEEKAALLDEPLGNVVLIAPPGCGKTEALALRARGLLDNGLVKRPHKILAVAFSNRARDNIGDRIETLVGGARFKQSVDLTNFHGLAARVYKAHAKTLGLDPDARMPEKGWMKSVLSSFASTYGARQDAEESLLSAKLRPITDDEVIAELEKDGSTAALQAEKLRQQEGRLDYADLLRHAQRILANPTISKLYCLHYGAILVDEFQDLTLQQLSIITSISRDNVTFAGDMGQAIYSFGGADPAAVLAAIEALPDLSTYRFNESYRSSPAVLEVVNAIGSGLGLDSVTSARPDDWIDGGYASTAEFDSYDEEAEAVIRLVRDILAIQPSGSVAVIARAGFRRKALDSKVKGAALPFDVCIWDNPIHRPELLKLLRKELGKIEQREIDDLDRVALVEEATLAILDPADIDSAEEIREACSLLREAIASGGSLSDELNSIMATASADRVINPGLHLLNAHVGKGQQFDWVFVIGMEEGHVPMFLAKTADEVEEEHRALVVMASRARHGIVLTRSLYSETRYGPRAVGPSRWWSAVSDSTPIKNGQLTPDLQRHLALFGENA